MLEKCDVIPKSLQIIDMPNSIAHSDFSKMVSKVLQHIDQIESCHDLNKKKLSYNSETSTRKDFEQVIRVKKD